MLAFDIWINKHHPELLTEFGRLPKLQKTQTFYHWVKENHPGIIFQEWPAVAKVRTRHLMREVKCE